MRILHQIGQMQSVWAGHACTLCLNLVYWSDFLPMLTGSAVCIWRNFLGAISSSSNLRAYLFINVPLINLWLRQYTIFHYSVQARLSDHTDWIRCMYLAPYPRPLLCVLNYLSLWCRQRDYADSPRLLGTLSIETRASPRLRFSVEKRRLELGYSKNTWRASAFSGQNTNRTILRG